MLLNALPYFDWFFVGTFKLSSHARLEAFVIQTKLCRITAVVRFPKKVSSQECDC